MVNMLHRKIHVDDGFCISKVVTSTQGKKEDKEHGNRQKFEDVELQALLDEDNSQTHKQLAEQLGVSQRIVSDRLREMGKIQKSGRWVPHESNDKQMEKRKNTPDIFLARYKRKSFLPLIVTGDQKRIYFENPKRKNHG